ncbi:MAG: 4Fe-4S dicluster domain-containing protein [Deltaproteobacteria bacterium]|nr:4Fe-4S dicluster domain-containing protein [Deltaproteobacteria bacterium]
MFFTVSFYIALALSGLGLLFKVSTWFRYTIWTGTTPFSPSQRILHAVKGIFKTLFSPKCGILLKVFLCDVLVQCRTLKESRLRWVMHMCIFWGFMLLLLLHALEQTITASLFADYASTLNPFLFLRSLFGLMVIAGLAIAAYRRFILKGPRHFSNAMDHYVMAILAVVMISGFALEATKIGSHSLYQQMVEDYADTDDTRELQSLESFWVEKFGVVSPRVKGPFEEEMLAQGGEIHEMSCAACHSRPQWAPLSYGLAMVIKPFALTLDTLNIPVILWYIHFLACFIGLAYLPFSRMFHIMASPLSLLANAVMDRETSHPANIATRQILELDACTHCGTCTQACAVGITFERIPNVNILPSEKIASVAALVAGKKLTDQELLHIQEGLYLCSNCYNCTLVCPVGINLQDLWFNVREALLEKGLPALLLLSPFSLYRGLRRDSIDPRQYIEPRQKAEKAFDDQCKSLDSYGSPIDIRSLDKDFKKTLQGSPRGDSLSYCFTCMTCSSSCPVVLNYENGSGSLDLLPHQIIHAATLGIRDPIYRSRMLWRCLGCYQCQENCPQKVRVADILFQLKNMAMEHIKPRIQDPEQE